MSKSGICAITVLASAMLLAAASTMVEAKPARCFTTDFGYFPCDFRNVEGGGSFEISAPGKSTIRLIVDTPGFAYGFEDFGNRFVPLPGQYVRQSDDPACWSNPETSTKICAW